MSTRDHAEPHLVSAAPPASAPATRIRRPLVHRRHIRPAAAVVTEPVETDEAAVAEEAPSGVWIPILFGVTLLFAFLLRFAASEQLSSHVDESASVMAIQMVAERGFPIFPSGTLYLQGATISYLLAPMALLGYGGMEHIESMRLLSVVAGTGAVAAVFLLARFVTGSVVMALLSSVLLALDPVSVRWSGIVRMYALLQLVTILVLFLFLVMLQRPASRRVLVTFIALFWFGVFTHIAICLFLPPIGLIALWKHRWRLLDERRDLSLALAGAGAAPVALLAANMLVTPSDSATSDGSPGVSFVGDYLLSAGQLLNPIFDSWTLLFRYSEIGTSLPLIIVALTCFLAGRYLFATTPPSHEARSRQSMLGILLVLYWLPILMVASFATEANERYLLHLHPVGLVLILFGVYDLYRYYVRSPRIAFAPAEGRGLDLGFGPFAERRMELGGSRVKLAWLTGARVYAAAAAVIIGAGIFLRLSGLQRLSLWLDEGFSLLYASQSWPNALGLNGFYSPHPTLYFVLTKVATLFLPDTLAGRAVAVTAGILTLPVFFLLARRILTKPAALIATSVLALSPIHLYYSQEARMYSLVVLIVAVSYLALIRFLEDRAVRWAVVYGFALAIGVYADYSTAYAFAPQVIFIAMAVFRWRKAALPLVIAGVAAVLAYVPWMPQVLASINSANEVERRQSYLGAEFDRVLRLVMHLTGFGSDNSNAYFPSLQMTPWDRWPAIRLPLLLVIAVIAILGIRGIRRDWRASLVISGLLGTILVGLWITLISPGFAERTILTAVMGWALLIGAMFNRPLTRLAKAAAMSSVAVVLIVGLITIQTYQTSAIKQRWAEAAEDFALIEPLNIPIVTYSYGGVVNTLLNAYEPEVWQRSRVINVRDGQLEKTLSNDLLPKIGVTLDDLRAGQLAELLPPTPENDLVWYLYYQRAGQEEVAASLVRQGYNRVLHHTYEAPRWQVFLDLYARPDADLGQPLPAVVPFSDRAAWNISPTSEQLEPSPDGTSLTIRNQSPTGTAATLVLEEPGAAIYTLDVVITAETPRPNASAVLQCRSLAGTVLEDAGASSQISTTDPVSTVRLGILCPPETARVQLSLPNNGFVAVTYSGLQLRKLAIP